MINERAMCIKRLIGPTLKPTADSYFSPISADWLSRISKCKSLVFKVAIRGLFKYECT